MHHSDSEFQSPAAELDLQVDTNLDEVYIFCYIDSRHIAVSSYIDQCAQSLDFHFKNYPGLSIYLI